MDPIELILPFPICLVLIVSLLAGYAWFSKDPLTLRPIRRWLVAATVWCWVFATPGLANLGAAWLEGTPTRDTTSSWQRNEATLVVVLASGSLFSRNGLPYPRLDASGWERLRAGIALRQKLEGKLLFTGGPGNKPDESLAGIMRGVALEAGVPNEAILISANSKSTYEDLLLAEKQLATHKGEVWLVTSAIHMPRALGVAEKLGLSMRPFPCDYQQIVAPTWRAWLPDNHGPDLWYAVLHEFVGRQYYRLRGWSD